MRAYGREVADEYIRTINGLKGSIDTNAYYRGINYSDYSAYRTDMVSRCIGTVNVAKDRVIAMNDHLEQLSTKLRAFYSNADMKLFDIDIRAKNILPKIEAVSKTVDGLYTALRETEIPSNPYDTVLLDKITSTLQPLSRLALNTWNEKLRKEGCTPENLEAYKEFLKSMGIENPSKDQIAAYIAVEKRLSEMGFSDEAIYRMTPAIYKDPTLDTIIKVPYSGVFNDYVKGHVRDYARDSISVNYSGLFDYDLYFDPLFDNLSMNDIPLVCDAFIDPDTAFEGMSIEERRDFMIRFAIAGIGYKGKEETGYDNDGNKVTYHLSFFGDYYTTGPEWDKLKAHWCAMYAVWCLSFSGLLNEDTTPISDYTKDTATDPYHCWAGVTEMKQTFDSKGLYATVDSGYLPAIGDLVVCHCGGHVAIVAGVDEENKCIYTIEGNNVNNAINIGFYDLKEDIERPGKEKDDGTVDNSYFDDVLGFCKMGGDRRDMDFITPKLDAGKEYLDWNAHVVDVSYGGRSNDLPQFYLDRGFGAE